MVCDNNNDTFCWPTEIVLFGKHHFCVYICIMIKSFYFSDIKVSNEWRYWIWIYMVWRKTNVIVCINEWFYLCLPILVELILMAKRRLMNFWIKVKVNEKIYQWVFYVNFIAQNKQTFIASIPLTEYEYDKS